MEMIFQLLLAFALGSFVGLEREYKKKEAGLRTYSLVSLGAALLTLIALDGFETVSGSGGDPVRVLQAVAIGIGFLGAGLIIHRQSYIEGLTTAAGLWVVAAIGMAVGAGLYFPAVFTALIAIGILSGLRLVEEKFFGTKPEDVA
jgi:putative Mg2+ transporter-C (MgtC) family protein